MDSTSFQRLWLDLNFRENLVVVVVVVVTAVSSSLWIFPSENESLLYLLPEWQVWALDPCLLWHRPDIMCIYINFFSHVDRISSSSRGTEAAVLHHRYYYLILPDSNAPQIFKRNVRFICQPSFPSERISIRIFFQPDFQSYYPPPVLVFFRIDFIRVIFCSVY